MWTPPHFLSSSRSLPSQHGQRVCSLRDRHHAGWLDLLHLGRDLHLALPHGPLSRQLRVPRVRARPATGGSSFSTPLTVCVWCEQVLGSVSAALRLLLLLAGQHGPEHHLAAAVGPRVRRSSSAALLYSSVLMPDSDRYHNIVHLLVFNANIKRYLLTRIHAVS